MVPLGYKFRRACKLVHDYSKDIILTRRTYTSQVRLVKETGKHYTLEQLAAFKTQ